MDNSPYFTDRNELRKPSGGLIRLNIPNRVRNSVQNSLEHLGANNARHHTKLISFVVNKLELNPAMIQRSTWDPDVENQAALNSWLNTAPWEEFLDACTAIYQYLENDTSLLRPGLTKEDFANRLNESLGRNYSVYSMTDTGAMVEPGSAATEAAVVEARSLLSDPAFNGPDRQFQTAQDAFQRQPNPDYEQTVADALNAVEGTANIVNGTIDQDLSVAMANTKKKHGLHGALVNSINNLFGFASDTSRHGRVGDPKVDRAAAEFCLHQAAATIVLLARLHETSVVEPGHCT